MAISAMCRRVLAWDISTSTARIMTAMVGLLNMSFLASSRALTPPSALTTQSSAFPLRTKSDARQISARALSLFAKGS